MVGKISFVGVKTEFEPTPAGAYESKFIDFKFGKTKPEARNPNVDKVDLQFACTEENEWKNRRWFRTCTFTADSLWAFKRTMAALGADVDWEDPEGVDPEAICRSVHNNPCIVKVGLQEYVDENDIDPDTGKGKVKQRNQVDDIVPTEGMRARMLEEARAASTTRSA
jgi:hypothetical protein